jgi:glyoxylate reductase
MIAPIPPEVVPMSEIVVTCRLPDPGLPLLGGLSDDLAVLGEELSPGRATILAALPGCRALVSMLADTVDAELLDTAGDRLRIVANYAVGYNNIDVDACTERGIAVTNTPGVLTDATAEVVFALLLSAARWVTEGDRMVRAGEFAGWGPSLLLGTELAGKTFGLVGCGRIGQATGRIARGFGMSLVYTHTRDLPDYEAETGAERVSLGQLLTEADVVSLHVPLKADTHHLIGATELGQMKSNAILINTARGPVVDEAALVVALREGNIGAAGLDVYENEPRLAEGLAELPNAVLLPHVGSGTVEARGEMARLTAGGVGDVLAGRRPPNLVNPAVWDHRRLG